MLNDRFGIQARGGCACAGTYGHYLLKVSPEESSAITSRIELGDLSTKPGWIRFSLHPTTSNEEAGYITQAIRMLALNHHKWAMDYYHNLTSGEIRHKEWTGEDDLHNTIHHVFHDRFGNRGEKLAVKHFYQ